MTATEWGIITGVSVSHARATVDELTAARADSQQDRVSSLLRRPDVSEAFALQTCNRSEAYVVTEDPETGRDALADIAPSVREGAVVYRRHEESLRHLMAVAAGLRSLVIGEDQILGQVRDAYHDAREAGGVGPVLEEALPKTIHVGERVRTETAINEGHTSIGSAGVELATQELELSNAHALVVGAGEMGALAARSLAAHGIDQLTIANRTADHAAELAELMRSSVSQPVDTITLERLNARLSDADVVITATGSTDPVITPNIVPPTDTLVFMDLAQPRDVAPAVAEQTGVTVYDLDDLKAVASRTREQRQSAATRVESIIDSELQHLLTRFKRKRADEVIAAMYEGAEAIKQQELQQAFSQLEANGDLSEAHQEVIESMADALVNKLLAAPTDSLREAAENDDWTTIHTALELFDPHSNPSQEMHPPSVTAQDD